MITKELFVEPIKAVLERVVGFIPVVFSVILILIVGWLIAKIIRAIITKILKLGRLDMLSEKIGLAKVLSKGGVIYTLSELIGVLCYWLVLLIVFATAINALGLKIVANLLDRLVIYIPNVIAGIFILVLGMFLATFLSSIVQTAASNAGIGQARLLGKIVQVIIIIFAAVIALQQLNIAAEIITYSLNIILAAIGLGVAIAFGLGCKDLAGKFISDLIERLKKK